MSTDAALTHSEEREAEIAKAFLATLSKGQHDIGFGTPYENVVRLLRDMARQRFLAPRVTYGKGNDERAALVLKHARWIAACGLNPEDAS